MKVKLTHIQSGVNKWYAQGSAALGWKAVLSAPLVNLGISNLLQKNSKIVALLTDENGDIEIDALYKDYSEIINRSGYVELLGIRFNAQDLDSLYAAIKSQVPPTSTTTGNPY